MQPSCTINCKHVMIIIWMTMHIYIYIYVYYIYLASWSRHGIIKGSAVINYAIVRFVISYILQTGNYYIQCGRHSRIPDFLLRIFPNWTLAQNTYACLSWVCLAMLPSTKMKLTVGFVHMLINLEILVLSCALNPVLFCNRLKACGVL